MPAKSESSTNVIERHLIQFADGSFLFRYNSDSGLEKVRDISHAKLIPPQHSSYLARLFDGRVLVVLYNPDTRESRLCIKHQAGDMRSPLSLQSVVAEIDRIKEVETLSVLESAVRQHRADLESLANIGKKDERATYAYKDLSNAITRTI